MDLVKIVVPVYNTEEYLEQCLLSIQSQTYQNFVAILIDDGSTDSCPTICDNIAKKDHRFHVVHQVNKGLSAARNVGLNYPIHCDYVSFVDSDDWLHPEYLETLISSIRSTNVKMEMCMHFRSFEEFPSDECLSMQPIIYSVEDCYCMTEISTTPAWGKLYHVSLFEKIEYPVGKIHEDYYVTWKLLFQLNEVAVIHYPLYYYRYNVSGIMHSLWTPNRMDVFPALYEKILYFQSNFLIKAEQRALKKTMGTIEKYIEAITGTEYASIYLPILVQWKSIISKGKVPDMYACKNVALS